MKEELSFPDTEPVLKTERLCLRGFSMDDVPVVANLLNDRDIAERLLATPYPYAESDAREWIEKRTEQLRNHEALMLAITLAEEGAFIGGMGMSFQPDHHTGEIGYWIGKAWQGRGYCTEATKELVRYGFEVIGLNRIHAHHFSENPASGRVMQKLGMEYEGFMRQAVIRFDKYIDLKCYAILREDYEGRKNAPEGNAS